MKSRRVGANRQALPAVYNDSFFYPPPLPRLTLPSHPRCFSTDSAILVPPMIVSRLLFLAIEFPDRVRVICHTSRDDRVDIKVRRY